MGLSGIGFCVSGTLSLAAVDFAWLSDLCCLLVLVSGLCDGCFFGDLSVSCCCLFAFYVVWISDLSYLGF